MRKSSFSVKLPTIMLFAAVFVYLMVFLFAPLLALGAESCKVGMGALVDGVTSPESIDALINTAILTLTAIVVNLVFGVAAGLTIARQRFWGREFLNGLVDIPLAISPVMVGLAFILVFGRTGWLGPLLGKLDLRIIFSFPGLVLATLFVTLPFTTREVVNVLWELGDEEEQAATTLGASRLQTLWYVTLPNLKGALSCGISLTAARSLGEFGAVLIMGGAISGSTHTATTWIYTATDERNDGAALGLSLLLGIFSVALLLVVEKFRARSSKES